MSVEILTGDCREVLAQMEPDSFDACVTDPPYLLEFMGEEFDKQHKLLAGMNDGQRMQAWHHSWAVQVFRVLKPGAFIAAFGGERTFHRLYSALEDAGFEPRTTVLWLHSQGFPKSRNVTRDINEMEWCNCDD